MGTLRILIADDHAVIRAQLRDILESVANWQVCAEAEDGEQAVRLAKSHRPDVVVMDVRMPRCNGLDATRKIRHFLPETHILITTLYEFAALDQEARKAGASGCFAKAEAGRQLIPAVRTVTADRPFFAEQDYRPG